jgi:predicted lipid-binding transport protein (Tim44 family)
LAICFEVKGLGFGMDALNLILLAVAAVVAWRFWTVLGTRTGFEKPPIVLQPKPDKANAEAKGPVVDGEVLPPEAKGPVWQGYAAAGSELATGLETVASRSPGFSVESFLQGAKAAYEMVLEAFAHGNKQALKPLLSKELLDSFNQAIDARTQQGRNMKFQFVGVKSADLKTASLVGNKAQIEVAFMSDMISATLDKSGDVIEGDAAAIRTVADLWTFERDVTSRDPNWKLVATDENA